jgi:hypothetical protein
MNEHDTTDAAQGDPLLDLLNAYTVAGSDIESRVLSAVAQEENGNTLRREVAALRAEVAALRTETSQLKQLLLANRMRAATMPAAVDNTRGIPLLPYARRDTTPSIFE